MDTPSLRKVNTRAPKVDGVCLSIPEAATDEEGPSQINFVQSEALFCSPGPLCCGPVHRKGREAAMPSAPLTASC